MFDLWLFASAVFSHWVASMSGVVAITAGIIQWLRKAKFNPTTWIAIGMTCLLIASYQAWLDEHTEGDSSQKALREAECKMAALYDRSKITIMLSKFIDEANVLSSLHLQQNDPNAMDQFINAANDWDRRLTKTVKANLGDAALAKINDLSGKKAGTWTNQINELHGHILSNIDRTKQNIETIIENPSWDDIELRATRTGCFNK